MRVVSWCSKFVQNDMLSPCSATALKADGTDCYLHPRTILGNHQLLRSWPRRSTSIMRNTGTSINHPFLTVHRQLFMAFLCICLVIEPMVYQHWHWPRSNQIIVYHKALLATSNHIQPTTVWISHHEHESLVIINRYELWIINANHR